MSELPGETGPSDVPCASDADSDRPTVEMSDPRSAEICCSDRPTLELMDQEPPAQNWKTESRRTPPLPPRAQRPHTSLPPLDLSLSEPPEEVARLAALPPLPGPPLDTMDLEDTSQLPLLELDSFPPASASPAPVQPPLDEVPGLRDLTDATQDELWRQARFAPLAVGDPVPPCTMFRVLEGWVDISPATSDHRCGRAASGDVVFTEGTTGRATVLRCAAGTTPAVVAHWNTQALTEITRVCPWVEDELRMFGDHLQARAGAVLGRLGSELTEAARFEFLDACHLLCLLPWESLTSAGSAADRLHVVGAGTVELLSASHDEEVVSEELSPGEFVLARAVLAGNPAPASARAGAAGALLLYVSRVKLRKLLHAIPSLQTIVSTD